MMWTVPSRNIKDKEIGEHIFYSTTNIIYNVREGLIIKNGKLMEISIMLRPPPPFPINGREFKKIINQH